MKQPARRSESQPFKGVFIQPVFDHFISSSVIFAIGRFLRTYCRSSQFKFSLEPRTPLVNGLAKFHVLPYA